MRSTANLLGHPVHQMLIVLPLGLLVSAVAFDVCYLFSGLAIMAQVAYWNIALGIVTGLAAAVFGIHDWLKIPAGTRAKFIGAWHGGGNVLVIALFAIAWYVRRDNLNHVPETLALATEFAALGLGGVTAWLGGELVDRLGIGVHEGAHPDAPSSLSGRPATEHDRPASRRRDRAPAP